MLGKQMKSIVATEMGYVTVTGPHDAVKCHLRFVRYHARNSKPMPTGPDPSECVGPREEVAMSADRSQDWIARELGDVPYRNTGGLWELVAAVGVDGPLPSSAWTPGRIMEGELVRSTDGTMGRLGAGVTLRD